MEKFGNGKQLGGGESVYVKPVLFSEIKRGKFRVLMPLPLLVVTGSNPGSFGTLRTAVALDPFDKTDLYVRDWRPLLLKRELYSSC